VGRDGLLRRIEGLCNGPVEPSVTPVASFAVEEDRIVLVLRVPRGDQPIYYCQNTPYVRHLTQSRPARPNEVIQRIEEWLSTQPQQGDPHAEFYGSLVRMVRELLVWTDELEERQINPWLDSLKWMLQSHGADLRRLAATNEAERLGLRHRIQELADQAEVAGSHTLFMDQESWGEFAALVAQTRETARKIKADAIDPLDIDPSTRTESLNHLSMLARQLSGLSERADRFVQQGRIGEFQTEVSSIGRDIVRISYWGLDRDPENTVAPIRSIGKSLHVLETVQPSIGGREVSEMIQHVAAAVDELNGFVSRLGAPTEAGAV
jgi:hypothetical protein